MNTGVLTWSATNVTTGSGSVISNLVTGTLDLVTNLNIGASGAGGTVDNAGLLRKSGGTATAAIYDTLRNTGTIRAERGTLWLGGGGVNSGSNSALSPGTLTFGGVHTLDENSSLTGDGLVICAGTVKANGAWSTTGTNIVTSGALCFNGTATMGWLAITGAPAILGGSGSAIVSGPLTWTSGSITGRVQCAGGTISGGFKYLTGGNLINSGAMRYVNDTIYASNGSVISNLSGATFDVAWNISGGAPPYISSPTGGVRSAFYNEGLLRSAGFSISTDFYNNGTLQATNGTTSCLGVCQQTTGLTRLSGGKLQPVKGFALKGGCWPERTR